MRGKGYERCGQVAKGLHPGSNLATRACCRATRSAGGASSNENERCVAPVGAATTGLARHKMSLRQYSTSSPDSRGRTTVDPRERNIITSVEGFADTIVTCGGTKPGGSQARIDGRRSTGSRAMRACSIAPTRAPEGSRSPHSSIVHVLPTMLTTT